MMEMMEMLKGKENIKEYLRVNPVEESTKNMMKEQYGITEAELTDYNESKMDILERSKSNKRLSQKELDRNTGIIDRRITSVNQKLQREIKKNWDNPDAIKIIIEKSFELMPNVYKEIGKGKRFDERAAMYIAEDKRRAESRVINKNLRRSPEALYEQLKVESIDTSNMNELQVDSVRKELYEVMDQGSMRIVKNTAGAVIAKRDEMKYREVRKTVIENQDKWNEELKKSKVQGDTPFISTSIRGNYDEASDYGSLSSIKAELDKMSSEDYREQGFSTLQESYIKAAESTMGYNSSEAEEIGILIRQFNPIDFAKFSKTYRRAEIWYVYATGGADSQGIIGDIKTALVQANGGYENE